MATFLRCDRCRREFKSGVTAHGDKQYLQGEHAVFVSTTSARAGNWGADFCDRCVAEIVSGLPLIVTDAQEKERTR